MTIFMKPQKSKKGEHLASYIVDMMLHLGEKGCRKLNGWTIPFLLRHFTEITDLEVLSGWKRKIAEILCFIGNVSLSVAIGSFFSDQYKGLLGIPIAFGFYLGAVAIFKWAYNETL